MHITQRLRFFLRWRAAGHRVEECPGAMGSMRALQKIDNNLTIIIIIIIIVIIHGLLKFDFLLATKVRQLVHIK